MFGVHPMFTVSNGPLDPAVAGPPCPVDSGDPNLDLWADQHLDFACKMSLGQLDKPRRAQILWVVKAKVDSRFVQGNPSAYTQGVIRREITGGPFRQAQPNAFHTQWPQQLPLGQQAPSGSARPGPYSDGAAAVTAAVHTVATPLRSAAPAAERPSWVTQAWSVHSRQPALFRIVAKNVPKEAMDAIVDLPGPWQLVCAQVLLLCKHNYADPVAFMKNFAEMYKAMPSTGAQVAPTVASPRGTGRPVVVLHLGTGSGFEISALQLAAERIASESHAAHISEIVMIDIDNPWQLVIDELLTGSKSSGPAVLRINPTDAAQQLASIGKQWRDQGAAIVAAVVVPPPVANNFGPAAQAPSNHAGAARELWGYLSNVKYLAAMVPRLGVVVFTAKKAGADSVDADFFNKHFGNQVHIQHEQVRIPHSGWSLRCCPRGERLPWIPRRLAASPINETIDPELAAAADANKPFTAVLPDLVALEELVEKRMQGEALSDAGTKTLNLLLRRKSGGLVEEPARLLDRTALTHIFGLSGWRVLDYWSEKLPCSLLLHPFTGQPVGPTFQGALPCGQLRYCPACCAFYDCIMTTPSPFVYSHGIAMAVHSAHFCTENRPGVDFAALPAHFCPEGCVGHLP